VMEMPANQEILLGGIVTGKKEIINKKKERMAFITLSDLKGSVEVVVFANVFRDCVSLFEDSDVPLLVRGRVEASEDRGKILASEIMPLESATERLSLTLHLTISRPEATEESMASLGRLLRAHGGRARVVAHVVIPDRSETAISMPESFRVSPNPELLETLRGLFGKHAVRLEAA